MWCDMAMIWRAMHNFAALSASVDAALNSKPLYTLPTAVLSRQLCLPHLLHLQPHTPVEWNWQ